VSEQTQFLQTVYYFGCDRGAGHYLHSPGMRSAYGTGWHQRLEYLDGSLAPKPEEMGAKGQVQFKAKFWRLDGFTPQPYSALSWWDRTVDSRTGSNTIMFVPGQTITPEIALECAKKWFPEVMGRLPGIEILPGEHRKTWAPKAGGKS
jgi:hypothetical protein